MRELILGSIGDLILNLLYYDRKEDEDLPVGVIEEAVKAGTITIEEMVKTFETELREALSND